MKNILKIMSMFVIMLTLTSYVDNKNISKTISIVVIGDFPKKDVLYVQKKLSLFYKCEVNILPKIGLPTQYKVKGVNKYHSINIVKFLNKKFNNINGKVIGLTNVDICTDRILNGKTNKNWGVLGLALLGEKSCIVSNKRMKSNYSNKLEKVSIHEIGHALDIPHCESNDDCLMNDAKGKGSKVDKVKVWICSDCKNKIKF